MAAARGFAVNRDGIRPGHAQTLDPVGEACLEQVRVNGCDHLAQRVVARRGASVRARDAVRERQEAAQERQVLLTPQREFDEIVGPRHRAAQEQKQQFRQEIQHLGRLTRELPRDWGCKGLLAIFAFVLWPRVDAWLGC